MKSTLLILFFSVQLTAQFNIDFIDTSLKSSEISWYNIQSNNSSEQLINSYFLITAKSEGILVYESRTKNVALSQGVSIWNKSLLEPVQESIDNLNQLAEGKKVFLELILINTKTGNIEGRTSKTFKWKPNNKVDDNSDSQFSLKEKFQVQGSIGITAQTANRMGVGSTVPNIYLRADGRTSLAFSGIPVDLGFFVTTEQSGFKQSMNRASASLNVPLLKQNLKSEIDNRLEAAGEEGAPSEAEVEAFKSEMVMKEYPDYASLVAQFEGDEGVVLATRLQRAIDLGQLSKSKSTRSKVRQYKRLSEKKNLSSEDNLERIKLQQLIMQFATMQKELEELEADFGKELRKLKEDYLRYTEAENYYASLTVDDYKKNTKSFNVFSMLNKTQRMLNMLQGATIGVSYPNFSRYTLNGLSINGIHLELTPGEFYLATSYGRSARQTYDRNFAVPTLTLNQRAFGIKTGYGQRGETYLHLSYTNVTDMDDPLGNESATRPESNSLFGLEGGVSFLDNKLSLEGEWAGSLFTEDMNADVLSQDFSTEVPLEMLHNRANSTSSFDQAYRLGAQWQLDKLGLDLGGEYERLGSDFRSLGAPTLLANLVRWKADLRKGLFDNKVQLMLYGQREDNSIDPSLSTVISSTESFGGNVMIAIPKFPQITASYAPFAQRNEIVGTQEVQQSDTKVTNLTVSYPYSLFDGLRMNTQLSYADQTLTSNLANSNFKNTSYGFNQNINFKELGFNLAVNYAPDQKLGEVPQDLTTYNFNGTYSKEKFRSGLGYQLLKITNKETKYGFNASLGYNLTEAIAFDLRAQRNIYDSFAGNPSFRDYVVNAGLRINFGYDGSESVEQLDRATSIDAETEEPPASLLSNLENEEIVDSDATETSSKELNQPDKEDIKTAEAPTKASSSPDDLKDDILEGFVIKTENKKHHYKIYFHIDNTANKSFISLISLGPVTWIEAETGVYLYFIGQYSSKEIAERRLSGVKARGYENAYILEFKNGEVHNKDK